MKKPIGIGYEDIKRIADEGLYYVDKTMMIKELIDNHAGVSLFTRPRRFGKTLNISTIRRFFEDERDDKGVKQDNSYIFQDLKIASCGEKYMSMQGQYPVITLTLKGAKQPDFEMAYEVLRDDIYVEFARHIYVLESDALLAEDRAAFEAVLGKKASAAEFATSLKLLSRCLKAYFRKDVIILIDEYDVPLENAYFQGFYDEMAGFIRSLFESALKTNPCLEFAVVTGCLRISRESIFTGLNNLEVHSVIDSSFADCFGFTEDEVKKLTDDYDVAGQMPTIKKWYDGYRFGDREIYNPWSIINYVKDYKASPELTFPKPYWSNTSSNSIIKELVEDSDDETRARIELLMNGGTIEKPVHEDITYDTIHASDDNLWNFLYFTGYLTEAGRRYDGENTYLTLRIPNTEIGTVYRNTIVTWFENRVKATDMSAFYKAILDGDCETMMNFISDTLMQTISFYDYSESYYHGFLTGLLRYMPKFVIKSNFESGQGRPDILMTELKFRGRIIIFELKVAKTFAEMEGRCDEALRQIEEQKYAEPLFNEGYSTALKYGVCFCKKGCMVK